VLLENNSQEQLIFKHAISTVVSGRAAMHLESRPDRTAEVRSPSLAPTHAATQTTPASTGTEGAGATDR
jgi:host factor-I protein